MEGDDFVIFSRAQPIKKIPTMSFGNMPNDNGHLILSGEEKKTLLGKYPEASDLIHPLISSKEYFNNIERWCIWLKDIFPTRYKGIREIEDRIKAVRDYRLASKRSATNNLAKTPYLFGKIRQSKSKYILVPRHSSERRNYIPFSYYGPDNIVHDSCLMIPDTTIFHFGIISSSMHMSWVRQVCGRLESRYRYSAKLVYNNFPWPPEVSESQKEKVEQCAQAVLDIRQGFLDEGSTLADLYDPLSMPDTLLKAHQGLDKAVDRCYRRKKFESERERVEFLFELYNTLTKPLIAKKKKRK